MAYLLLLIGMAALYLGAEGLVRGAIAISRLLKIPPLVISLTVVALATSMPEGVTTILAQAKNLPGDVALGNIIGSNIANIGLVLGLALLFCPCERRVEVPAVFGTALLLLFMMLLGPLGPLAALLFLVALALFFIWQFKKTNGAEKNNGIAYPFAVLIIGALLLFFGADWLLRGAVQIATNWGISERVIALSVIAFGTSLPELAATLIAAKKQQKEIIIGNVIGSNILNPLLILPIAIFIRPIVFTPRLLYIDMPVLLLFSMFLFCKKLTRYHGALLLVFYAGYVTYLYSS